MNVMGQQIGNITAYVLDFRKIGLDVITAFGGKINLADAGDDQQA